MKPGREKAGTTEGGSAARVAAHVTAWRMAGSADAARRLAVSTHAVFKPRDNPHCKAHGGGFSKKRERLEQAVQSTTVTIRSQAPTL